MVIAGHTAGASRADVSRVDDCERRTPAGIRDVSYRTAVRRARLARRGRSLGSRCSCPRHSLRATTPEPRLRTSWWPLCPRAFRGTCTIAAPQPDDRTQVTQLVCVPKQADHMIYTKYPRRLGRRQGTRLAHRHDLPGPRRPRRIRPSALPTTTYRIGSSTKAAGRVYCFLARSGNENDLPVGTPVVTWTYEPPGSSRAVVGARSSDVARLLAP